MGSLKYSTNKLSPGKGQNVEIFAPEKPGNEVLSLLKKNGFTWSPWSKRWYCKNASAKAILFAQSIAQYSLTDKSKFVQKKLHENDLKEQKEKKAKLAPVPGMDFSKDIPYQKAYNAYQAISFDPEKRAKYLINEYVQGMTEFYHELEKLAKTPAQKEVLRSEFERYRQNYLKRELDILAARSRTMSPMITGPARFPVARNQKALNSEQNKINEKLEWDKKATAAIKKSILNALTPEEKKEETRKEIVPGIKADVLFIIGILKDKKAKKPVQWDIQLFRVSLMNKLIKMANSGDVEQAEQILKYADTMASQSGTGPVFAKNNRIYSIISEIKEKQLNPPQKPTGEIILYKGSGVKVVNNLDAERVQVITDSKPSNDIISRFKSRGFRWSPFYKAWQRQNTRDGIEVALNIAKSI